MPNTPEVTWVGPGWYKLLTFAVGNQKVVQVSQNKGADIGSDCVWFDTIGTVQKHFGPKKLSKREVY